MAHACGCTAACRCPLVHAAGHHPLCLHGDGQRAGALYDPVCSHHIRCEWCGVNNMGWRPLTHKRSISAVHVGCGSAPAGARNHWRGADGNAACRHSAALDGGTSRWHNGAVHEGMRSHPRSQISPPVWQTHLDDKGYNAIAVYETINSWVRHVSVRRAWWQQGAGCPGVALGKVGGGFGGGAACGLPADLPCLVNAAPAAQINIVDATNGVFMVRCCCAAPCWLAWRAACSACDHVPPPACAAAWLSLAQPPCPAPLNCRTETSLPRPPTS